MREGERERRTVVSARGVSVVVQSGGGGGIFSLFFCCR